MNKSKLSVWLEIRKVRLEINEIETNKETERYKESTNLRAGWEDKQSWLIFDTINQKK